MTQKTRADLTTENNSTFASGSGILASNERAYNDNLSDSCLNLLDTGSQSVASPLDLGGMLTGPSETLTAFAGGGQGSATQIVKNYVNISVCATAADSVKLPAALAGRTIRVQNKGAQNAELFPQSGEQIAGTMNVNDPVTIIPQTGYQYDCYVDGTWENHQSSGFSTPTFLGATVAGTNTYILQELIWQRVGFVLMYRYNVLVDTLDPALSGAIGVDFGMTPQFNSVGGQWASSFWTLINITWTNQIIGRIVGSTEQLRFVDLDPATGLPTNLTDSNLIGAPTIRGSGFYFLEH